MKCPLSDAWTCWVGRSLLGTPAPHLALASPQGIGSDKNAETGRIPTGSQCCCSNVCTSWVWGREIQQDRAAVLSSGLGDFQGWKVLPGSGHCSDLGTLLTLISPLAASPVSPGLGALPLGQTLPWLGLPRLCHIFTPQHWVCTRTCLAPHPSALPSLQPCSPHCHWGKL